MALRVAIQMDLPATIDVNTDSTFFLMVEAARRRHLLFYYLPETIAWHGGELTAMVTECEVADDGITPVADARRVSLASMDLILMRQDPPFNMNYITFTYLLQQLPPSTVVVNDPFGVRNMPEKIFWRDFAAYSQIMPATLITRDKEAINDFRAQHGAIIIKPLYGNGGEGILYISDDDKNFNSLYELFIRLYDQPFIAQQYIANVAAGDKRVILVDGEPVGAINRIPVSSEVRSNIHVGGRVEIADLSERDKQICDVVGPDLRANNIIFAGIDIIDGLLTEVNVTSPTGLQEINRLADLNLAIPLWDAFEQRLS